MKYEFRDWVFEQDSNNDNNNDDNDDDGNDDNGGGDDYDDDDGNNNHFTKLRKDWKKDGSLIWKWLIWSS